MTRKGKKRRINSLFLVAIPVTRKKKKTKMKKWRIIMMIQEKAKLAWMSNLPRAQGVL